VAYAELIHDRGYVGLGRHRVDMADLGIQRLSLGSIRAARRSSEIQ